MELIKVPVPVPSDVWLPEMVGLAAVLQQTPRAMMEEPPSEVMFPPELAVVCVTLLAAVVVSTAPPGTKVRSPPVDVPSELVATTLK